MKYTTKKYCSIEIINKYPSAVGRLYEMINRDLSEAIINEAEKGEVIVRLGDVKEEAQVEFNGMTTFRREINIKPLIRCKDCQYRGKMVCPFGIRQMPRDNDFCFYGKRREDDK